jgi:hypothetical protein
MSPEHDPARCSTDAADVYHTVMIPTGSCAGHTIAHVASEWPALGMAAVKG